VIVQPLEQPVHPLRNACPAQGSELAGLRDVRHLKGFHFYTLNRAELAYAISHLLGVRGKKAEAVVAA
jgi:5,10-methylenetetrahydrofolate reductase